MDNSSNTPRKFHEYPLCEDATRPQVDRATVGCSRRGFLKAAGSLGMAQWGLGARVGMLSSAGLVASGLVGTPGADSPAMAAHPEEKVRGLYREPGLLLEKLLQEAGSLYDANNVQILARLHQDFLSGEWGEEQVQSLDAWLNNATRHVEVDLDNPQTLKPGEMTHTDQNGSVIMLLRVGRQGAPVFGYQFVDLEVITEPDGLFAIPIVVEQRNWVLLRLARAPVGVTDLIIQLDCQSATGNFPMPLHQRIEVSPPGYWQLDLRDEKGQECPATLRIVSLPDGNNYRPAGAVEFAPQMDDIGGDPLPVPNHPPAGPGRPYPYCVPGPRAGFYWCVDGSFEMSLPHGHWQVTVCRGLEYEPELWEFEIAPGEHRHDSIQLSRWTNQPSEGWFSGDMHIHSRLSSDRDAERLLIWLQAAEINVANILQMGNATRTYYPQRGFGKEARVQRGNYVLVPGQEDPRAMFGHAVGVNLQSLVRNPDRYLDNHWVADEIHRQGGLYGHAHMIFNGFNIKRDLAMLMPSGRSDFGEILQSGMLETELYHEFLNLGFQLAAAASSDVPYGHTLGEVCMYAYTGKPELDPDAWFESVRAGHTFVSTGPMVKLEVNGAMPGTVLRFAEESTLAIRVSASGSPRMTAPELIEVLSQGDVAFTMPVPRNQNQAVLEVELPVRGGCWIAARVTGRDGSQAHTTPVYVERQGLRWWKMEAVPSLLAGCLETLQGIEDELNYFSQALKSGQIPSHDFYVNAVVAQAPMIHQHIAEARQAYQTLDEQYQHEITTRKSLGLG